MGYSANTTLLYGVEINPTEAELLHKILVDAAKQNEKKMYIDIALPKLDLENIVFGGEEADSTCHSCTGFEKEYSDEIESYFVGVGISDEKSEFSKLIQKGASAEVLQEWNKLLPYLQSANIDTSSVNFCFLNQTL